MTDEERFEEVRKQQEENDRRLRKEIEETERERERAQELRDKLEGSGK